MPIYYCDGRRLRRTIEAGASWLSENKELVNNLNVFPVPDGDTGTNMSMTLKTVLAQLANTQSDYLPEVASAVADSSLWGARGSSGVILSQILGGLAEGVGDKEKIGSLDIAYSLKTGSERAYAVIDKPAEGTILTLLREASERAVEFAKRERDIAMLLRYIVERGEEILVETRDLLPELKRAGVIDAGGKGFLLMVEGVLRLIEGLGVEEGRPGATAAYGRATVAEEVIAERYCLDFVVKGRALSVSRLKSKVGGYGDDLLAAGSDSLVKVHIHTDHPDTVLEVASNFGEVEQVKIDDMRQQYERFVAPSSGVEVEAPIASSEPRIASSEIGILAVASGEGLINIFENLGTEVVAGGQTMNPSVSDIQKGVEATHSEEIIILPNNSNIIPAAEQVKGLTQKRVGVVPTRTIPEGIAAAISFSPAKSFQKNLEDMKSSLRTVKTGELTRAVRDGVFGNLEFKKGDYIGLYNDKLRVSGKDAKTTLFALLREMVDGEDSMISLFCGSQEENVEALTHEIESLFPDTAVEVHYGGQPHYDYIVSVE